VNREEILRQELRVLEELERLEEEEETVEEEQGGEGSYDWSGLRALSDPRNLTGLRRAVWPGV